MKLIIDKESFKSFSKIILTCTKLGEDIFFDFRHDYFTIKSVNDARSLFFFTKFERRFFEDYQVPEQIECKFKSKSCIIPFKSNQAIEKHLSTLEFFVDKDSATFQMNFDTDDITSHEIGFVNTNLQADLDEDVQFENYLMVKIKTLSALFNNFPNANDYCVMNVCEDKVCFETYNFKAYEVRTAFTVKSEIFQEYKIASKIRTTFLLKPMKTFLKALDPMANCYFYFDEDYCPIHVIIRTNFVEHKFIIASIDIDFDSVNDQTTNNIPTPRDIQLNNSEINDDDQMDDEPILTLQNGNNQNIDSSSSYDTDHPPSFNKSKTSVKIKNERYKSIYSTETEDTENESESNKKQQKTPEASQSTSRVQNNENNLLDDGDDFPYDGDVTFGSNSFSGQKNNNQPSLIQSQIDVHHSNTSRLSSQIISNKSNHSNEMQIDNQTSNAATNQTSTSTKRSLNSHGTQQQNDDEIITFDSQNSSAQENNQTSSNQFQINAHYNESSQLNSQIISNKSNHSNEIQTNNQTNSLENQTSNVATNQTSTSTKHSTQENEDANATMKSINISRIENSSMNDEFDDWNLDDLNTDLLANDSLEKKIKRQKTAYDDFSNRMPSMCENDRKLQEGEQKNLFTQFINKNRNLLP